MDYTLAERIKLAVGTGRDPTELTVLDTLDNLTATAAEINTLAGVTAGTVTASKALVTDANKDLATLRHLTISGNFVTGSTTLSEAELGVLDAVVAGTVSASKALVVGANKNLDTLVIADSGLKLGSGAGTAITATAAQINAAAAPASRIVNVSDATPYTVLAADSGKIHILPNFTASTTMNLPAVAAGLEYTFVGKAVAADAQNWVFTAPASAFLLGGVAFADNDAGAGADEIHAGVYPNGSSHLTLTVVTPAAGTSIYFVCDGTNWIVSGWVNSATVPAFS